MTEKNGPLAGLTTVAGDEDIMLVTDKGVMIRFSISDVSQTGRATLGVHLIKIDEDSRVSTVARVQKEDETEDDAEEQTAEVSSDNAESTDETNNNDEE